MENEQNLMVQMQHNLSTTLVSRRQAMLLKIKSFLKSRALKNLVGRKLSRDQSFDHAEVKAILVLRFDRIGDMVVTTPFLRELKRVFPSSKIDVLCSPINSEVLTYNPHVSNRPLYSRDFASLRSILSLRGQYELIVDLNHSPIWSDMLLIRVLNPIWAASVFKAGRYGVGGQELKMYRLMPSEDPSGERRIARRYLHLAEYLGGQKSILDVYDVHLPPRSPQKIRERVGLKDSDRYWVLNQHGGRPGMALRSDDIRTLIETLLDSEPICQVVWLAAPDKYTATKELARQFFQDNSRLILPTPSHSVLDAAEIIKESLGLISPDTSLVHFAAAFNRPCVVAYANEMALYDQWRPPKGVWHKPVFSNDSKSLEGYDSGQLIDATKALIRFVNGGVGSKAPELLLE